MQIVVIDDTATGAVWTGQVETDGGIFNLNLTSAGGATLAGETVTVTFTGAAGGIPRGITTPVTFRSTLLPPGAIPSKQVMPSISGSTWSREQEVSNNFR